MPYSINKSNGDLLVVVEDGTADLNTTSLALVGRNYAGYGEYLNENFVKLLENFAKSTQPNSPITGQLWYDTTNQLLKVFNGSEFVSSGGGIELDKTTINPHYLTFVETEVGLPQTKIAKEKGLNFTPSTGNFAINKATGGTSRLEINNGVSASRGLNATLSETAIHLHGNDGQGVRVLLDTYGGADSGGPNITFRRGPLFGQTGSSASTTLDRVLGTIGARGHSGVSLNSVDRAALRFVASQTWSGAANGTKIEFLATANGTTVTEVKAIIHNNGDFEAKGDIIGFSLSDERLKTKITKIDNALDKIENLQGVFFNWNEQAAKFGKESKERQTGLLAGQVHDVLPEATKRKDNGMLAVDYEKLIGLVVEAIKELKHEVRLLKTAKAI